MSPGGKRKMSQVLGARPNAKMALGGGGYIVVDGSEELSDRSGAEQTPEQAWARAFQYIVARLREGTR